MWVRFRSAPPALLGTFHLSISAKSGRTLCAAFASLVRWRRVTLGRLHNLTFPGGSNAKWDGKTQIGAKP